MPRLSFRNPAARNIPCKLSYIVLIGLLFLLFGTPVSAAAASAPLFAVSAPTEPLQPGKSFSVTLTPQTENLSAFVLTAEYDSSVVSAAADLSDSLHADHAYTAVENNTLTLVYAASGGTMPKDASVTLNFRTAKDTVSGSAAVLLTIQDAADPSAAALLSAPETYPVEISFLPAPSADCSLLSLNPSAGKLSPDFNPAQLEYTLEVPFSCRSLTFEAMAAEGASYRVNRKNLGAGGSTTDFFLTVTAADGKTKTIYTIHVTRLAKDAAAKTGSFDAGTPVAENAGAGTEQADPETTVSAASVSTGEAVVTVTAQQTATDPLVIAAIVLLSAAAGMLLVLGAQHLFRSKEDPKP